MNPLSPRRRLTASEHAAIFEQAKRRSIESRRQAIDAFWAAAARGVRQALHGAQRHGAAALAAASASLQRIRTAAR